MTRFRFAPKPEPLNLRVGFMPNGPLHNAVNFYRGYTMLSRLGCRIADLTDYEAHHELVGLDAVYIQGGVQSKAPLLAQHASDYGLPVIMDVDDNYLQVPETHPQYNEFASALCRRDFIDTWHKSGIRICATQTLKEQLLSLIGEDGKPVEVIGNAMPLEATAPPSFDVEKKAIIRFGHQHLRDLISNQALRDIADRLCLIGEWSPAMLGLEGAAHHPWTDSVYDYLQVLDDIKACVMLVPYSDTPFNRAKSPTVILEAIMTGKTVLCPQWYIPDNFTALTLTGVGIGWVVQGDPRRRLDDIFEHQGHNATHNHNSVVSTWQALYDEIIVEGRKDAEYRWCEVLQGRLPA